MMTKAVTGKMLFYESIAGQFDSIVNKYDTVRRLQVVYGEFLRGSLSGKKLLDAGCGTGWFSMAANRKGADVTSMDVGPELLEQVEKKCRSTRVAGSILEMPFKSESFDIVVSSEVVEHVTSPKLAIKEMFRVLKPGGTLVITTPNKFWHWSLLIANLLGVRKYQGLENWLGYQELQSELKNAGFKIVRARGLHLFPFVVSATHPLLRLLDKYHFLYDSLMVNSCVKAIKQ